jgi:hypothetical protein
MAIILGIIMVFFPFVPLIFVANWATKLMQFEKYDIPYTVSLLNPIKQNSEIIINHLVSDLRVDPAIAKDACRVFRNCQISVLFYILTGPLHFISIIAYIIVLFKDYANLSFLYENSPNQLSAYIVLPIVALISFWIIYGSSFFDYVGLKKSGEKISKAIQKLFDLIEKISKKAGSYLLLCIYFISLLFYLINLIPLGNYFGAAWGDCLWNPYAVELLWYCLILSLFYYLMPKLLAHIYSKLGGKLLPVHLSGDYVRKNLKNTTYLQLLFLYVFGMLSQNSDGILLQAITILFLFDTYLAKTSELKNALNDKKRNK